MIGAWTTTRLYCGKQLELDNVIVSSNYRNKGIGAELGAYVEDWARQNDYLTVELNSYVTASSAHKFYFSQGYKILGFHFYKPLSP